MGKFLKNIWDNAVGEGAWEAIRAAWPYLWKVVATMIGLAGAAISYLLSHYELAVFLICLSTFTVGFALANEVQRRRLFRKWEQEGPPPRPTPP